MHRTALGVTVRDLERLEAARPHAAHYLDRHTRRGGRLLQRWNLIVPQALLARTWDEFSGTQDDTADLNATNYDGDGDGAVVEEGI
jgi:hypothetical protein